MGCACGWSRCCRWRWDLGSSNLGGQAFLLPSARAWREAVWVLPQEVSVPLILLLDAVRQGVAVERIEDRSASRHLLPLGHVPDGLLPAYLVALRIVRSLPASRLAAFRRQRRQQRLPPDSVAPSSVRPARLIGPPVLGTRLAMADLEREEQARGRRGRPHRHRRHAGGDGQRAACGADEGSEHDTSPCRFCFVTEAHRAQRPDLRNWS